ncbi:hypothetical protein pb186bvf_014300 [Paramecium bursaria]
MEKNNMIDIKSIKNQIFIILSLSQSLKQSIQYQFLNLLSKIRNQQIILLLINTKIKMGGDKLKVFDLLTLNKHYTQLEDKKTIKTEYLSFIGYKI